MNKTIKLAVAGAVLATASAANAGIIIPAGEWTLDINGNVNAFATFQDYDDAATATVTGGIAGTKSGTGNDDQNQSINTGLLPAWLGFTGTTRQNDVDVSFTISMQPNVSGNDSTGDGANVGGGAKAALFRQAFLTFGDASWGSFKFGKDLGIYAGNAILNDMTLLGVGGGYNSSGASTTFGGIGTGYMYPSWKGQMTYTTPNMNGFQAKIAITNPNQSADSGVQGTRQDRFGIEAQAEYSFSMGKVWVSGLSNEYNDGSDSWDASTIDIGTALTFGNAGLTAYYYSGEGLGTTFVGLRCNNGSVERDADGGYIQGTYVIPTGTKLGVAYGVSRLDLASGETNASLVEENNRWTVGAYHPLTKHLNLVAEYNQIESESQGGANNESSAISVGAILFF